MEIIDNKVLVVRTRRPQLLTDTIKKSKVVRQIEDMHEVAVHWGLSEAQALVDLKMKNIPSPIDRDYKWTGKFQPFAHQKLTAGFLSLHRKAFCFSEQGTGKTASVIWAADYLMKMGVVRRVLVICPLSIMKAAWQNDIFKFAMHRSCSIAHGSAKARKQIIAEKSDFTIINFDGVAIVKDEILNGGFDLIVIDEASAYKNSQTTRWKVLKQLTDKIARLWMLTGTPAAQSPVDAFGLAKLVNPAGAPKFFGAFRDQVMMKVTNFKWVPKPNAKHAVHTVLQPAIRFERAQCLDLPEVTYMEREAPLTPQQKKYYKMLRTKMAFEAAGEKINSVNAAVNINKLLQISGGAVYTESRDVVEFDVSNRLNVVLEAIEEASHKVLVFVPFTHTIQLLEKFLEDAGVPTMTINGQVSMNKRSAIVEKFQTEEDPKVLLIQPQAASHGLTLTAANTIIWYAPMPSVETYLQANARINRPGQKNPMTIIHIRGSEVENKLYSLLQNNVGNHTQIVELYKQALEAEEE
jgi:SNF2 family DNA or RNA helicase